MLTFLTGFVASVAHVVTGPDHLAAVTPLAIDSRKKSWMIGLSWGLGHTIGMLLIGLLFVLFKEILPVELISKHSETAIGILLIGIGGWAILRTFMRHSHGNRPHSHFHTRPFLYAHFHKHSHSAELEHKGSHPDGHEHDHPVAVKQNAFTALSIGIFHGFAGFSHLFALLPSLALPTVWASVIYVTAFALGTILTMVLFAFILGLVAFRSVVKDNQVFLKWFTFGGGLLAIAIGILWLIHPV
ncbi:MAG: nickel transporter [Bacteroidetes bacterium]|nr:nickel transporter [Bacteroidota bacterium]